MNYVFLDTNIWLYFATGKNSEAKADFSNTSIDLLDQIEDLVKKKKIKLLKNEIIDFEFRHASIDAHFDDFQKHVLNVVENNLKDKVMIHSKSSQEIQLIDDTIRALKIVEAEFKQKFEDLNRRVMKLHQNATSINVSEKLKQRALTHSMRKDHPIFESNDKNNINDFLMLYSIQEWIENSSTLSQLDETSSNHAIYFVTRNDKDFKIDKKNYAIDERLGISQLIKPLRTLHDLPREIKKGQNNWEDFMPYKIENEAKEIEPTSFIDLAIEKFQNLIELKRELFKTYVSSLLNGLDRKIKLKYVADIYASNNFSYSSGDIPIVRSQNIIDGILETSNLLTIKNIKGLVTTKKGDILLVAIGKNAGEIALNTEDEEMLVHPTVYVIRSNNDQIGSSYLFRALATFNLLSFSRLNRLSVQFPKLRISEVRNLKLSFASQEEQSTLLQQIEEKESEIHRDILDIKRKIKFLLS